MSKLVKSADGTEIYANAIGDPSKPALVFIHGFSLSTIVFDPLFADPKWTDHVYLVRYDMRGHGRSGKPVDEVAWESKRLAEDFDAVAEAFKLCRPFVVGWSLGATNIADVLTLHPPSYLSGIIYVTALPYMGPTLAKVGSPAGLSCLPHLMQTTDVNAYQTAAQTFVTLLSDSIPHVLQQACLGNVISQPRAVTIRLLSRTQDEKGLLKAGRADLPLLVINGSQDNVTIGSETINAVKGWKDLTVVVMDKGGHMPWLGEPDRFRDEVLGWVKKAGGNKGSKL